MWLGPVSMGYMIGFRAPDSDLDSETSGGAHESLVTFGNDGRQRALWVRCAVESESRLADAAQRNPGFC